jgi:hypothetical protein
LPKFRELKTLNNKQKMALRINDGTMGTVSTYVKRLAQISERKKNEFSESSGGISSETVNRLTSTNSEATGSSRETPTAKFNDP